MYTLHFFCVVLGRDEGVLIELSCFVTALGFLGVRGML